MGERSVEEIDREIATRGEKVDAMSATLLEVDAHPGLAHVKRYPPTGVTATRWSAIEQAHARLWEDLGTMTSTLDAVRALRNRRDKPSGDERAELSRLLFERSIEVARHRVPLAQRTLTSRAEVIETIGLTDVADRMALDYRAVVEFLDAVDGINSQVVSGLAPVQGKLDRAGVPSPKELVDLLAQSATDPLSLTPQDVQTRIAAIVDGIADQSAQLAELAALQADWPAAVAATTAQLDELREVTDRAGRARERAQRDVLTGPLPVHPDAEPALRAELDALSATTPAALRGLRVRIAAALRSAAEAEELAQGLLDRRSELSGRLTAYQAKAARLGLGEDVDLMAQGRIAAGLLSRRPCDLREVTRAVADYQQQLTTKRGAK